MKLTTNQMNMAAYAFAIKTNKRIGHKLNKMSKAIGVTIDEPAWSRLAIK